MTKIIVLRIFQQRKWEAKSCYLLTYNKRINNQIKKLNPKLQLV